VTASGRLATRCAANRPNRSNRYTSVCSDLQRIVNLDAEVAHCALQLGMAEQELHHSEVLCSSVDQ
jgi:hypothetical protein